MADSTPRMTDGAAAAAVVASGIGALSMGLLTTGAELSTGLKTALTLNAGVGPLSGKTIFATVAYIVSWIILHTLWKDKDVDFGRKATLTAVLLAGAVLLTFPIFFQALAGE